MTSRSASRDCPPRVLRVSTANAGVAPIRGFCEITDADDEADAILAVCNPAIPESCPAALARVMKEFRERIERDETIQLLNVEVLIRRFTALQRRANEDDTWPISIPFTDADGPLAIELWRQSGFDRIQVASLFGDILDVRPPDGPAPLRNILDVLNRWTDFSITPWLDTMYRSALHFLANVATGVAPERAASATDFVARGGNHRLLVRLAAEFVFLRASSEPASDGGNGGVDLSVLRGFAERDAERNAGPWRIPFELGALPADDSTRLSGFERHLCLKYATDVLEWDGSAPPYPAWLKP